MTTSIEAKPEAVGQTNISMKSVRSEYAEYKWLSQNKNVSKFVVKFLNTEYCLKDILTFLGLDYRDASLIILYLLS